MNYAEIKYYDIANGPGVRTSLFVSGCRHHCPGCFNQVAWDFGFGKPFDKPTRNAHFAACQPDYISGLSLLGASLWSRKTSGNCCPLYATSKRCTPTKRYGATPATPGSS